MLYRYMKTACNNVFSLRRIRTLALTGNPSLRSGFANS